MKKETKQTIIDGAVVLTLFAVFYFTLWTAHILSH